MLLYGEHFRQHRAWIVACVLAALGAIAWYAAWGLRTGDWPGGSSLPGFAYGVAGGLIILFEVFLWPRKKARTLRIGQVKHWMRAHIWLGLLCLPLLVLHSGFRWGGPLSTLLMLLLVAVILSGVWGLILQQYLPSAMLDGIPAETIRSQIDHVLTLRRDDLERLILSTCGNDPSRPAGTAADEGDTPYATHLTVGMVRTAGAISGKVLQSRAKHGPIPNTEPLRRFYHDVVDDYVRRGRRSRSPMAIPIRAAALVQDLKTRIDPRAHDVADEIAGLCDIRRQLDHQIVAHRWLHNWLLVHLPLSLALVVLMFVHVYYALRYL